MKGERHMADFFGNLKENLESLGKTISEKAEVVSKKTEEAVEVQKIKSQIRVMERNNERDFQDIGKIIYDQFKKGKVVDSEFVELCEAIEDREASIDEYKKQVAEIKGLDVCPNCKEHVEPSVVFCPKCGVKIEQESYDEDQFVDEVVEAAVEEAAEESDETSEETVGEAEE